MPLVTLLAAGTRRLGAVNLAELDIGTAHEPLTRVADQLGFGIDHLADHTIASGYPHALDTVAHAAKPPGRRGPQSLRYAACPNFLEQQRIERGFSWLRREWVLAARTICPLHGSALVEMDGNVVAHPAWAGHLRPGGAAPGAVRLAALEDLRVSASSQGVGAPELQFRVAALQTAMLTRGSSSRPRADRSGISARVALLQDILWAFTRCDALKNDRLVYEAFASDRIDSAWHIARRRQAGPVEFSRLPLDVRHAMMVTAVVLMGSPDLRAAFYPRSSIAPPDLDLLGQRLGPGDRKEFAARRAERGGGTRPVAFEEVESTH